MAQARKRDLAYVLETVPGTTPASPAFKELPVVSFNFGSTYDQLKSKTRRNNRTPGPSRRGNATFEGDMVVEAQPDTYDDFLQMAMMRSGWSSNSLTIGEDLITATIEESLDFGGGDVEYRIFRGVGVNTMSVTVGTDEQVEMSFGLIGLSESDFTGTSADASGYTATVPKDFFFHVDGSFLEGGIEVGFIGSISLELNNNITGNRTLGTDGYRNVNPGEASVTGSIGGLVESVDLYNKMKNSTTTTLAFTLQSGAETLTFTMNGVKLSNAQMTDDANEGVKFEFDFDASGDNALVITRA